MFSMTLGGGGPEAAPVIGKVVWSEPARSQPSPTIVAAGDTPIASEVARINRAIRERAARRQARVARARARKRARMMRKHYIWPVRGPITSHFGYRRSPVSGGSEFHHGTDIACPHGTPLVAPKDGRVLVAGRVPVYGKTVLIRHRSRWTTFLAHMSGVRVRSGQQVRQGQIVGRCGSTGWATGSHLHLEMRTPSGKYVDPGRHFWPKRR